MQCNTAARSDAITNRTRDRNHRSWQEAGQDTEQSAFHACHCDHNFMGANLVEAFEKTPKTGDSNISDQRSPVTSKREASHHFVCHPQVGSTGTNDTSAPQYRRAYVSVERGSRQRVVVKRRPRFRTQVVELLDVQSRQKQRSITGASKDCFDLRRCLAFAKHRFCNSGTSFALPVDHEIGHAAMIRKNAAPRR
jgi:hypothetical protein